MRIARPAQLPVTLVVVGVVALAAAAGGCGTGSGSSTGARPSTQAYAADSAAHDGALAGFFEEFRGARRPEDIVARAPRLLARLAAFEAATARLADYRVPDARLEEARAARVAIGRTFGPLMLRALQAARSGDLGALDDVVATMRAGVEAAAAKAGIVP